jgi:hypothetical protein
VGDWNKSKVVDEYHLALTRGVAGGRFLRWIEAANRQGSRDAGNDE